MKYRQLFFTINYYQIKSVVGWNLLVGIFYKPISLKMCFRLRYSCIKIIELIVCNYKVSTDKGVYNTMQMDIIKIGNSKGIRIPLAVLKQCGIDSKVELSVENNCIIIKPVSTPRQGWASALELMHKNNDDVLLISEELDNERMEVWDEPNH